jgi:hypothetical protein
MATTTNYSWTTPDDTALVKDGASAIRALGTAIDSSMNTALGTKKAGMVLLNTTSFSAVASQSFNNVFSATYDYYRIVGAANGSTTANLVFRLRAAGTDLSGANYAYSQYGAGSSTNSSLTSAVFGALNSTNIAGFDATLFSPFLTVPKAYVSTNADKIGASNFLGYSWGGGIDSSVSYDGFTIFPSSGTVTGKVSVYGYNL